MKLSELNDLDFNEAGSWPTPIKAIAILIVIAAGVWLISQIGLYSFWMAALL